MLSISMFPAAASRRPVARRWTRWGAVVAVSVLIHLVALDALPRLTIDAADEAVAGPPLRATLRPIAPLAQNDAPPPAAPTPAPARPATRSRPVPPRAVAPTHEPAFVPESFEAPQQLTVPAAPAAAPAAPPTPAPASATAAASEPPAPPAPPPPPTSPPQSARLDYRVVAQDVKQANPIYGRGTIVWTIADGRYSTDLKAAADVLFFKLDMLSSHSDGAVGSAGLAPDRYTESPRRRATVATNFNRDERQSITFSASQASAPLAAGAQDRLSILFQLGALLLADPAKTAAGTQIVVPVAGVRGDVEPWRFDVRGAEALETGVGTLSTTHLVRTPRPGSNDRTIDVWVAQADGGYPARVLYTEPSGSTVTMTLERIGAAESPR